MPSFACARAYLLDEVLRARLVEITDTATAHLKAGVSRKVLFGAMHSCDAPKFHEAMTVFAAAAACEGLSVPFDVCTAGLRAVAPDGEPHGHTMSLIGLPSSPAGTLDTYTLRYESDLAAPRLHVRVAGEWRPLESAIAFSRRGGGCFGCMGGGGECWVARFTSAPGASVAVLPFCRAEWDHPSGGGEYELVPGVTELSGGSLTRPAKWRGQSRLYMAQQHARCHRSLLCFPFAALISHTAVFLYSYYSNIPPLNSTFEFHTPSEL
jgi:hypothetical protein